MQYQVQNPYKSEAPRLTEISELDFNETPQPGFVNIPFSSQRVSCGLFGIVNDHVENYQSLDERFVKNKASTYFFEAESDSMSPLIMEKDILIVDRALDSYPGCIVVCSLNGEMFCKRLVERNGTLYLYSENEKYKPVELQEDSDFMIFGVVRGIAREFKAF
jgi:DNA polymerase V